MGCLHEINLMSRSARVAITKDHRVGALKQQTFLSPILEDGSPRSSASMVNSGEDSLPGLQTVAFSLCLHRFLFNAYS